MSPLVLVLAAALSAGNAEFDSTAARGALDIVVAREAARLAAEGPSAGSLQAKMLAAPGDYDTVEHARERARTDFAALTLAELKAAQAKAATRLGIAKEELPDLKDADGGDSSAAFERLFAAERKAACEAQAKTIVSATRPTEAEFDAKDEAALRSEMTARIAAEQKTPVFEENKGYISTQIVDPVLASARAERQRQAEYFSRARSEAAAPSRLRSDLEARFRANLEERAKGADAANAWGAFPSVLRDALPAAVERRTVDRLVGAVEGLKFDVTPESVAEEIRKDPAAHVKASESEKRFAAVYADDALVRGLEAAVAEAPEAERAELRAYLVERQRQDAPVKAADRIVRREVMPKWKAARAEAAARFASETWPTLADGTWYPSAELADAMAARSDYSEAVKGWREVEGLEELKNAPCGVPVMEEAADCANRQVAAAFDRARNAVNAQSALVDAAHPEVLATARERKASLLRTTPDVKEIVRLLTEATEAKWAEKRVATLWPDGVTPANAEVQHKDLFPSVRRKIELVAKEIVEEMKDPEPEEPKPEEEPPPEEPPEEVLEFALSIKKSGETISLKLEQGETVLREESVGARASDFEGAMRRITETLSRDALKLR